MANHISKIKHFSPYEAVKHKATSVHLSLIEHFYLQHFSFHIIRTNLDEYKERLKFETFITNLLKEIGVNLMNVDIPRFT